MKNNKFSFFMSLLFLSSSVYSVEKTDEAVVKLRLEKHLEAMMKGERSPLLKNKDYYSVIYLCKESKVEDIQIKKDLHVAKMICKTSAKILQNAESSPATQTKVVSNETITRTISFIPGEEKFNFKHKLSAPFVKEGSQKRYLIPVK